MGLAVRSRRRGVKRKGERTQMADWNQVPECHDAGRLGDVGQPSGGPACVEGREQLSFAGPCSRYLLFVLTHSTSLPPFNSHIFETCRTKTILVLNTCSWHEQHEGLLSLSSVWVGTRCPSRLRCNSMHNVFEAIHYSKYPRLCSQPRQAGYLNMKSLQYCLAHLDCGQ